MTIITKPNLNKGVVAQFSLNKANLLLHPEVQADEYFSEPLNWYRVNVVYKSSEGGQYEVVEFDATQETPLGNFLVSEKARDVFQVLKIKIVDFDNGFLEITRPSLEPEEWDINFAPSVIVPRSSSIFGYFGSGSSTIRVTASFDASNPDEMIIGSNRLKATDIAVGFELVLKEDTGKYDPELSLKLMDSQIHDLYLNEEGTVAWLLGEFNTVCCGKTIPAKPTDSIFGQTTLRIFKYDLVNDTIEFIVNLPQYSGPNTSGTDFREYGSKIIVKESANIILVNRGFTTNANTSVFVQAVSISNKQLLYTKTMNTPSGVGFTWRSFFDSVGDNEGFYLNVGSYEGRSGLVKINYQTGSIISEYPATPAGTRPRPVWACSPDARKQVILQQPGTVSQNKSVYIYVDGVISQELTLSNTELEVYSIAASNDHFYLLLGDRIVRKYSFDGTFVSTKLTSTNFQGIGLFTLDNSNRPVINSLKFYNGKLYVFDASGYRFLRFDEATGVIDSEFLGVCTSRISSNSISAVYFFGNNIVVPRTEPTQSISYTIGAPLSKAVYANDANNSDIRDGQPVINIVNFNTREIVYEKVGGFVNNVNGVTNYAFEPLTSSSIPGRFIVCSTIFDNNYVVYDRRGVSEVLESGWPTCVQKSVVGAAVKDNYLYLVGGSGGVLLTNWTDTSGNFFMVGQIVRINLTTKLVDRNFNPTIPNFSGVQAALFFTDNYVYISNTQLNFYRVKLSDSSAMQISSTILGVSFFNSVVEVLDVGSGNIIVYQRDKASNSRPYALLNEETLTQTGQQPEANGNYIHTAVYNPDQDSIMCLASIDGSNRSLMTFDVSTGVRTLNSPNLTLNSKTGNEARYSFSVFNTAISGYFDRIIYKDNKYIICLSVPLMYNYKVYSGIIRMDPFGVIDNF